MSLTSKILSISAKLPPAETHSIGKERDLEIAMSDGAVLLADHYYPLDLNNRPTILTQSVYNNRKMGISSIEILVEQGFQVLVVSSRGTGGSSGSLQPFLQERSDCAAVIQWLKQQSWFNGVLGVHGASYLGYTQWAFAAAGDECLKAMSTCLVGANAYDFIYDGGAFNFEIFYGWIGMVEAINKSFLAHLKNSILGTKKMSEQLKKLPLESLDVPRTGKVQGYWRELLAHPSKDDKYWIPANFQKDISKIDVPNHMVSGWYDVMLPGLMKDYNVSCSSGKKPFLTIGPWSHFEGEASFQSLHHSILWMRAILLGDKKILRKQPVKIYVMGANEWREYDSFPPAGIAIQTLFLHPGKKLKKQKAPESQPDTYTYDPSNPTPSVGGAYRTAGTGKSVVDNRKLEARSDVLTYETETFIDDLEIIGRCEVTLFFLSSASYLDFFVRVCDVHPNGASYNVCDGILRVTPENKQYQAEEVYKVTIELAPTAYRFLKGHKIRLQVSSGSFPRFNRNLGTNDSAGTDTTFVKAKQQIFHDQLHSSCVSLPVMNGTLL
ncbi:CocE/NonD family hydrolase [Paenibacillus ihbetae]|uniref:Xaa-Pro dipeptidyl-peptidase C-terminal domain-containing protein n=1 Tax=Paenibacillus ihbetae TaxID=1870820 RepID=A0A1B2E416_9BACL|nr:CocE/NonD family hydrolase [Paenibacillus ihbetae]ANY74652.1 hypothetical protein BBD41_19925 [Paenibacillus ihbetae]OOC63175.1 hypothetical protein BBD40_15685 [Paenibacillus ihbetae]